MTFEARFDLSEVDWTHMEGGPEFDYPVEFDVAVLGSQPDHGTLDLLVRFAPNSHCHFHRHVATTRTLVLQGEHHVFDVGSNGETVHKIKPAGTYSQSPAGEIHMERGGPRWRHRAVQPAHPHRRTVRNSRRRPQRVGPIDDRVDVRRPPHGRLGGGVAFRIGVLGADRLDILVADDGELTGPGALLVFGAVGGTPLVGRAVRVRLFDVGRFGG